MARPTDAAEWASTAGRRLEPTAGEKDSGFNEGTRTPARKANWIVGVLADWAAYLQSITDAADEHSYPVAKSRKIFITPAMFNLGHAAADFVFDTSYTTGDYPVLRTVAAGLRRIYLPLNPLVPKGGVISQIRAQVRFQLDTGHAIQMALVTLDPDFGTFPPFTPSLDSELTLDSDNGTTGDQLLDSGAVAFPIDPEDYDSLLMFQFSGEDHRLYSVELTFDDPGPRNV